MRSEDEIREELHYQIKQGFLDYSLNATTNPERIAFVNGIIYALKYVLQEDNQ
jgi:hypothetical protein